MRPSITIGSRGSKLALWQSEHVKAAIRGIAPDLEVEIRVVKTQGDKVLDVPLSAIGGKGVFTKEIETELLAERIDVAVHSLKDLPTENPEGLVIAAVPERASPYDAFVSKTKTPLDEIKTGAVVGTSSLRRRAQLLAYRPDLEVVDLRGNVPTRVEKVMNGPLDAIVLAAAGLERLEMSDVISHIIDEAVMLPAAAQGALAIQVRESDFELRELLSKLTHAPTLAEITAERTFLEALGGGCQTPIAAVAKVENDALNFSGRVISLDGHNVINVSRRGAASDAEALGKDAALEALKNGAEWIVAESETAIEDLKKNAKAGPARPLKGLKVVVTRPPAQGRKFVNALEEAGATVISFPTIATRPIDNAGDVEPLDSYDWAIFTSANAVRYFADYARDRELDLDTFRSVKICAVGTATSEALAELGLTPQLIPETFVAESLLEALLEAEPELEGKRILLPRGNLARDFLPTELRERGARVDELTLYETVAPQESIDKVDDLIAQRPDVVTFTSSSTAENFVGLVGDKLDAIREHAVFASIGPQTTETAESLGLSIDIQPVQHDIPSLLRAVVEWRRGSR